jgi:hypothetical protein
LLNLAFDRLAQEMNSSSSLAHQHDEVDLSKHCTKLDEDVTFNEKFQIFKVQTTLMIDQCENADNVFDEVVERSIEDAIEKADQRDVKMKYLGIRISTAHPKAEFGIPIREVHTIKAVVNEFMLLCYSNRPFYGSPFSITVTIVGQWKCNDRE